MKSYEQTVYNQMKKLIEKEIDNEKMCISGE